MPQLIMILDCLHAAEAAESASAKGSQQLRSLQAILEQAAGSRDAAGFQPAAFNTGPLTAALMSAEHAAQLLATPLAIILTLA